MFDNKIQETMHTPKFARGGRTLLKHLWFVAGVDMGESGNPDWGCVVFWTLSHQYLDKLKIPETLTLSSA